MNIEMPIQEQVSPDKSKITNLISKMISDMSVDKLMIETDTAPQNISNVYTFLANTNPAEMIKGMHMATTVHYFQSLLKKFFSSLSEKKIVPKKFGFNSNNSTINIWMEVEDDSIAAQVIMSESEANLAFKTEGVLINAMVFSVEDEIPMPSIYIEVPFDVLKKD